MSIDYGSLAAHVASALGALQGYGHGETAAAQSLQHVQDELMKLYEAAKEQSPATGQPVVMPQSEAQRCELREAINAAYWRFSPETLAALLAAARPMRESGVLSERDTQMARELMIGAFAKSTGGFSKKGIAAALSALLEYFDIRRRG